MSKHATLGGSVNEASRVSDWMAILRLDKKGFEILCEKVNLKFDPAYPIADPVQRLAVTLRFLVVGQGFHDSLVNMFMDTFGAIFAVMEENLVVRIDYIKSLPDINQIPWTSLSVAKKQEYVGSHSPSQPEGMGRS